MGAKAGFALKLLQWFIRGIQFCCCALVLAIFSYFLAILSNRGLDIPTWTRAVEGISGIGVLYTILGLLLLCCLVCAYSLNQPARAHLHGNRAQRVQNFSYALIQNGIQPGDRIATIAPNWYASSFSSSRYRA